MSFNPYYISMDVLQRLKRDVREITGEQFSGSIVIHVNQGGIRGLEKVQSTKINIKKLNNQSDF